MKPVNRIDIMCWFVNMTKAQQEALRLQFMPELTWEQLDADSCSQWKLYNFAVEANLIDAYAAKA